MKNVLGMLLLGLVLAACGFQPLYQQQPANSAQVEGGVNTLTSRIVVSPIADRVGQQMRNTLLDRLNPYGEPAAPLYTLAVDVDESITDLGIQRDNTATFAKLRLTANFRLMDAESGEVLFSGVSRSSNSYNILQSTFATIKAEEDARARGAEQVGNDIATRLAIFLKNRAAAIRSGS